MKNLRLVVYLLSSFFESIKEVLKNEYDIYVMKKLFIIPYF